MFLKIGGRGPAFGRLIRAFSEPPACYDNGSSVSTSPKITEKEMILRVVLVCIPLFSFCVTRIISPF